MLEQLKIKANDEQVQRAVLQGVGLVATFVASQIFAGLMNKGIDTGIDALMKKLHPTNDAAG